MINDHVAPYGDLSGLPRSVRWRIQLGLFVDPSMEDPTASTSIESCWQWNMVAVTQQNERFKILMEKYIEEEEEEEEGEVAPSAGSDLEAAPAVADIDPLTAMVREQEERESRKAELYLKYRKEKARRKRGLATDAGGHTGNGESDGVDTASLLIIEKDLKRLPHPAQAGQPVSPSDNTAAQGERITSLKDILYIYAQEHPQMGYRQGMHEIASYILYLLELEQEEFPDHPLFQPILPISFTLLERTLDQIQTAYDASVEESLQSMSHSILGKIHQNDPALFHHLINSPNIPPPPIYCTRWVRLLFSREMVGYENIFKLWDVFFEYNIMRVLEVATASRILLLKEALLNPNNNPLDLLMNVPQLTSSEMDPFIASLRLLMEQSDTDKAVQLPASQIIPKQPESNISVSPIQASSSPTLPPQQQQQLQQQLGLHYQPQIPGPQQFGGGGDPLLGPSSDDAGKRQFSFSKMRQSLGQKGESLRKKIITTTSEWKTTQNTDGTPHREVAGGNISTASSEFFASASEAFRNTNMSLRTNTNNTKPATTTPEKSFLFADPLMHPPPSPKQHQHEMWSQLLKKRIWIVQDFLMTIEQSEDSGHKVPANVWEALADLDRMQQELHHYSTNMK